MRISLRLLLFAALLAAGVLGADELMVCWGNAGDVPAVALLEDAAEARILLPGGYTDGRAMAFYLKQRGLLQLAELFMPTAAPFPRGAAQLADTCQIRQLTVAWNSRSRLPWKDLQEKLTRAGTAIVYRQPTEEKCWVTVMGHWRITYRQNGSAFRLELDEMVLPGETARHFYCEERPTGMFVVGRPDQASPLAEFPKSNVSGMKSISISD